MKLKSLAVATLSMILARSSSSDAKCDVDRGTNYTQNTVLDCRGGTCGDMQCIADQDTCDMLPGPCVLFTPDNDMIYNCTHGLNGEGFYVPNSCSVKCTGCVPRETSDSNNHDDSRKPSVSSDDGDSNGKTRKLLLRGGLDPERD